MDILSDKTAYLLSKQFLRSIHINDRPGIYSDETENAILDGILALIRPVMTFTEGRCVAMIRCSRRSGNCARRQIAFYFPAPPSSDASSSTIITIFGNFSELLLLSSAQSFHCILSDPGHSAGQTADTASSSPLATAQFRAPAAFSNSSRPGSASAEFHYRHLVPLLWDHSQFYFFRICMV